MAIPGIQAKLRSSRTSVSKVITHRFGLDQIQEAYAVFGERREGVIKVAIKP